MRNHTPQKVTLATIATLSAATAAQANITVGNDFALLFNGLGTDSAAWDIDGDFTVETNAFARIRSSSSEGMPYSRSTTLNTNGASTAFGFLSSGAVLLPLSDYAVVGASGSFGAGLSLFYRTSFGTPMPTVSNLLTSSLSQSSAHRIGFKFDRAGNTHYGVADLTYTFGGGEAGLSFTNVQWNDVAGQGITGAGVAVPEPAAAATGLGLLALGAVGLRRMRRDRKS